MAEESHGTTEGRRGSVRSRQQKRPYSPPPLLKSYGKRRNKIKSNTHQPTINGEAFTCDDCCSPYVINPTDITAKNKQSSVKPKQIVEEDGKVRYLCRPCWLQARQKQKKKHIDKAPPTERDKSVYQQEATDFAIKLASLLQDSDAEKLSCPQFVGARPCRCIQRYITDGGKGSSHSSIHEPQRAQILLAIVKEAKKLAAEKAYDITEIEKSRKRGRIGIGFGQKKSANFGKYVMEQRTILKGENYRLCERGVQRVLCYSNNFLHKSLKTENGQRRLERQKGKAIMGTLATISSLPQSPCCSHCCHLVAATHPRLLEEWRERATISQEEARRVLGEMLTPVGTKVNCFKFISMVTGISPTTISKVKMQMCKTRGGREPPEHGLCKHWFNSAQAAANQMSHNKSEATSQDDCHINTPLAVIQGGNFESASVRLPGTGSNDAGMSVPTPIAKESHNPVFYMMPHVEQMVPFGTEVTTSQTEAMETAPVTIDTMNTLLSMDAPVPIMSADKLNHLPNDIESGHSLLMFTQSAPAGEMGDKTVPKIPDHSSGQGLMTASSESQSVMQLLTKANNSMDIEASLLQHSNENISQDKTFQLYNLITYAQQRLLKLQARLEEKRLHLWKALSQDMTVLASDSSHPCELALATGTPPQPASSNFSFVNATRSRSCSVGTSQPSTPFVSTSASEDGLSNMSVLDSVLSSQCVPISFATYPLVPTSIATSSLILTSIATSSHVPSSIATSSHVPSSIATSSHVPSSIATSSHVPSSIATSSHVPSSIATSSHVPSSIATSSHAPTSVATSSLVLTSVATPSHTPSSVATSSLVLTSIATSSHAPTSIATSSHVPFSIATSSHAPTSIATSSHAPTSIVTSSHAPTSISTYPPVVPL